MWICSVRRTLRNLQKICFSGMHITEESLYFVYIILFIFIVGSLFANVSALMLKLF